MYLFTIERYFGEFSIILRYKQNIIVIFTFTYSVGNAEQYASSCPTEDIMAVTEVALLDILIRYFSCHCCWHLRYTTYKQTVLIV